jgi:uncharacterized alpha-E superfamily protein
MMLLIGQLRNSMQIEPGEKLPDYSAMLTGCLELLSAFSGMERENINRGSGWLFMSLGRRLERAIYLTRQLRVITKPLAIENWSFLELFLEVADSSVTYRTRYYTTLQPLAVLDVLIADLYEKLPRHIPADLKTMQDALKSLRAIDLQAISYSSPGKASSGKNGLNQLDRYLAELESLLPSWSNNLSSQYFSHARTLPITIGQ